MGISLYPIDGGDWILSKTVNNEQDYLDYLYNYTSKYFTVIQLLSGIIPLTVLFGLFSMAFWMDFDPLNEFEIRRLKMARDLKKLI